MTRSLLCLFVLWLASPSVVAGPVVGDVLAVDWGKAQRFELQRRIEPGQSLALCSPLVARQGVDWQFVASGPLAFSIYHRVGKQAIYAERRSRTKSLTARFEPPDAQTYCWSWTAPKAAAVQLQVLMRY